jgi:hypothetical protein
MRRVERAFREEIAAGYLGEGESAFILSLMRHSGLCNVMSCFLTVQVVPGRYYVIYAVACCELVYSL